MLARVAAREPAPGGGAVAALTVAASAALVAMAARFSDELEGRDVMAERGDALGARAVELAAADGRAYGAVLAAYRQHDDDAARRGARIREALAVASDVPLAIIECAEEVGALGARLAVEGNPNLAGDAITAVTLAEAAARSATHLVRLNVELGGLGAERTERARVCCAALQAAVRAAEGRR